MMGNISNGNRKLGVGDNLPRLVEIMALLRSEQGCPWDREQTHRTLKPCVVEETYEVLEAIDGGNPDKLKEELGDLLLQVVFHAQLATETGQFSIDDVVDCIAEKLIRRHPHVFSDTKVSGVAGVLENWEKIKKTEMPANENRPLMEYRKIYRLCKKLKNFKVKLLKLVLIGEI